ncbi:unnamed protein product [Dracunculus medinensis]|uniref:Xpo1 domain-containing protein n=1 Tax=Dracunculus medinensis TaxID=318479 RepID=A0A158Q5F3_DRAME|nr:unnamed protein product [Dracunculus medinensis]
MTDINFGKALEAIRIIYDPLANNNLRLEAYQLIESIKEFETAQVQRFVNYLISLDDVILNHVDSRISIRNECFKLIGLRLPPSTAACRCIVSMIKHEWPQNWPELFDQFDQIARLSPLHVQIPFAVLEQLVEDVIYIRSIDNPSRRKDINNGIGMFLSQIIRMVLLALDQCALNYFSDHLAEYIPVAQSAISLLSELVEWMPSKTLELYIDDITARCIGRIASRKHIKASENRIIRALFSDFSMKSILTSADIAANVSAKREDHYLYLKALCEALSSLGIHLSEVWNGTPPNFSFYLSAMEAFFCHPSVHLRRAASDVYVTFTAQPEIVSEQLFDESFSRIIVQIPILINKPDFDSPDSPALIYSQIDYDGIPELIQELRKFRERAMQLLRYACDSKHGEIVNKITIDWLQNRCIGAIESVSEAEWESMLRVVRINFSGSYVAQLLDFGESQIFVEIFDRITLLLDKCSSVFICNFLVSILSALFVILKLHPDHVVSFLNQIRKKLLYENWDEVMDEKSIKRHCFSILMRLLTSYSDIIKNYAQNIFDICVEVRPYVSIMQLSSLTQVLAELSNLCPNYDEQTNFLASVLHEPISFFKSPEIISTLQSDLDFLNYYGFTEAAPQTMEALVESPFLKRCSMLRSNLSMISHVLSNVRSLEPSKHPVFSFIQPILPNIFRAAARIKSLHSAQSIALIHSSYGPNIFDITYAERLQLLNGIESSDQMKNKDDILHNSRNFFFSLHETIQTIVALMAQKMKKYLFMEPQIGEWSLALISGAAECPDFRIRYWIRRCWTPFLCSCPQSVYTQIRPFMLSLASELYSRLSKSWEKLYEMYRAEESPSPEEIFAEHVISFVTREVVALLHEFFGFSDKDDEKKDSVNCDLLALVWDDREVLEAYTSLSFLCLACNDSAASYRVIPICKRITDMVKEKHYFDMAPHLLIRCIQGIQHDNCEVLFHILQQVPECTADMAHSFDSQIRAIKIAGEEPTDKMKRQIMKKILQSVIAVDIGNQHRRPVRWRHLSPIPKIHKVLEEDFTALGLIFDFI